MDKLNTSKQPHGSTNGEITSESCKQMQMFVSCHTTMKRALFSFVAGRKICFYVYQAVMQVAGR